MITVKFGDKELKLKPSKELEDMLYEFTDEYTKALLDISSKYNYYDARGWDSKAGSILTTHCGTKHLDRIEKVSELLLQIPEYKKEYDKVRKDSEPERIERGKQNFANMLSNLEEDFDIYEVVKKLKANKFIPDDQKNYIAHILMDGEEKQHFADIINKLDEVVKNAPNMYETDGKKDKKPVLHYFYGNYDAYAYELDKQTGEMFGHVSMGYGYELGYFSMEEINSVPQIELDLYFDNKLPKELLRESVPSKSRRKRIDFEDDLVTVYDGENEVYKGTEDYEPDKDEDWLWDEADKSYYIKGTNLRKYCYESFNDRYKRIHEELNRVLNEVELYPKLDRELFDILNKNTINILDDEEVTYGCIDEVTREFCNSCYHVEAIDGNDKVIWTGYVDTNIIADLFNGEQIEGIDY